MTRRRRQRLRRLLEAERRLYQIPTEHGHFWILFLLIYIALKK
jgi:hypothetical protein